MPRPTKKKTAKKTKKVTATKKKTKTVGVDLVGAGAAAESEASDAQRSLELLQQTEITNQTELEWMVRAVAEVKDKHGEVDTKRLSFVEPLKAVIDDINAFFKGALTSLIESEKVCKAKVTDYVHTERVRRLDLLGQVENNTSPVVREELIEQADNHVVDKVAGMSLREGWDCEVTDREALVTWAVKTNQLHLLQPDPKALTATTKAYGSDPGIPGWRAAPKTTVAITVDRVKR